MAFSYKLEYIFDNTVPSDASVFIQMRHNPPVYRSQIGKENYEELDPSNQSDFITGLFSIAGIVEISSMAYRLWVMKSPTYTWVEVNTPLLNYLMTTFGETTMQELPGSANIDGTGFQLSAAKNRRAT